MPPYVFQQNTLQCIPMIIIEIQDITSFVSLDGVKYIYTTSNYRSGLPVTFFKVPSSLLIVFIVNMSMFAWLIFCVVVLISWPLKTVLSVQF